MKVLNKKGKKVEIEQDLVMNSVSLGPTLYNQVNGTSVTWEELHEMGDPNIDDYVPTEDEIKERLEEPKIMLDVDAGQDMAVMLAKMQSHVQAYESFDTDIDVIKMMSEAAHQSGYYYTPDRQEVFIRKDKVSTILRFRHRQGDYSVVEVLVKFGELNQRHITLRTFVKSKGSTAESLVEVTPTSEQDLLDAMLLMFSSTDVTPIVAARTARRYIQAMKTNVSPADVH